MAVVFRFRNQLTRYMTATGAANNAKRRANNISSFFMADLPSLAMSRLPDQGKDIRDCHYVLELCCNPSKAKPQNVPYLLPILAASLCRPQNYMLLRPNPSYRTFMTMRSWRPTRHAVNSPRARTSLRAIAVVSAKQE